MRTIVGEQFTDKKKNAVDLDVEKHRYPVYRQLVKIISYLYSPLESNEPQEKYRQESLQKYENPNKMHLHIAIVIHNELGPPESTLCRVNMCGQLGWHVASIEGGLTYCCSLNELKYTDLVTSEGIPDNSKPFDLNEILPEGANPAPPVAKVRGKRFAIRRFSIVIFCPFFNFFFVSSFIEIFSISQVHIPPSSYSITRKKAHTNTQTSNNYKR